MFYMASYSYISDVSDPKTRTKRFAYLDGVFPLGFYIGNSLGGIIKKTLGFYYNFGLGMICASMAVLYCIFFVQDSRLIRDERIKNQNAKEMQEPCSKEHSSGNVLTCILSFCYLNYNERMIYIFILSYYILFYFPTPRAEIRECNDHWTGHNQRQGQQFQATIPVAIFKRRIVLGVTKKASPPANIYYPSDSSKKIQMSTYFWITYL